MKLIKIQLYNSKRVAYIHPRTVHCVAQDGDEPRVWIIGCMHSQWTVDKATADRVIKAVNLCIADGDEWRDVGDDDPQDETADLE